MAARRRFFTGFCSIFLVFCGGTWSVRAAEDANPGGITELGYKGRDGKGVTVVSKPESVMPAVSTEGVKPLEAQGTVELGYKGRDGKGATVTTKASEAQKPATQPPATALVPTAKPVSLPPIAPASKPASAPTAQKTATTTATTAVTSGAAKPPASAASAPTSPLLRSDTGLRSDSDRLKSK